MTDWRLVQWIARFLKDTKNLKLGMRVETTGGRRIRIESWSDADSAADKGGRKSVTGGVVTMDGYIIQWICKKQTGVSLSTMEVVLTSASHVEREPFGLWELVRELGFEVVKSMPMHMDNQVVIKHMGTEDSMEARSTSPSVSSSFATSR
ncbi:hypothetical protein PR001_g6880 [Phytophthora rubi]|uniref:Uncharacterized protein n=1 Tax=Phytophthora rubi TaxID=129364 RepID=A0A6A3N2P6_9STRA|nr:hypothetical protein PR002_g7380 [Phytophthora rubi]KAE9040875.1 hypothetical protein PR001_g6880 [Phytophthora rubi]